MFMQSVCLYIIIVLCVFTYPKIMNTQRPDQVLKSCLKVSHLAKRVCTHTSYSAVNI